MPTIDTFIIPPVKKATEQVTDTPQQKKKSAKGKWAILIGLVILIISLPIGVYYFSQQQQIADTRSRATEGVYPTIATGDRTAEGTYHSCGYLSNTGSSGPAKSSCDSTNCGGKPCGAFTFKCGGYCLDTSCGSKACHDDPGTTSTATPKPTTTPTTAPTTTTTPTVEPTNPPVTPNKCDASCISDANCESDLRCASVNGINRCRKSDCPNESNCSCPGVTATPTIYYANKTPVPTKVSLIASVPIVTPTNQPTPKIPVAGVGPGIFGAISVVGSILLLVVGLVL